MSLVLGPLSEYEVSGLRVFFWGVSERKLWSKHNNGRAHKLIDQTWLKL